MTSPFKSRIHSAKNYDRTENLTFKNQKPPFIKYIKPQDQCIVKNAAIDYGRSACETEAICARDPACRSYGNPDYNAMVLYISNPAATLDIQSLFYFPMYM